MSGLRAGLDAWSKRQAESKCPPNLGGGGALVAAFVTSYFAAGMGDALLVILLYGPRAFFVGGLRVSDWKHGVLSNGDSVGPLTGLSTFPCWILLIICAEIAAGLLRSSLGRRPRWVIGIAQFLGGSMLLGFCAWLFWRDGFLLLHPIPAASLIGGGFLIWKALRSFAGGITRGLAR
jgi:hypothetical protein